MATVRPLVPVETLSKVELPIPPVPGMTWADAFPHLDLLSALDLGEGVQGFEAEDLEHEAPVVLLLLQQENLGSRKTREERDQAYRLLRQIEHRHLARVLDFGSMGGMGSGFLRDPWKMLGVTSPDTPISYSAFS